MCRIENVPGVLMVRFVGWIESNGLFRPLHALTLLFFELVHADDEVEEEKREQRQRRSFFRSRLQVLSTVDETVGVLFRHPRRPLTMDLSCLLITIDQFVRHHCWGTVEGRGYGGN